MKLNNSNIPTVDEKDPYFEEVMAKKVRKEYHELKKKRCKVCDLYHKLRKDDLENIASKKSDTPNISYRIKAKIVHEEWDGITKLNAEQTKPVDMIYCPLCGKKLWEDSFASGKKSGNRPRR